MTTVPTPSDEQRDQIGARLVTMQANGDRGDPQNAGRVGVADAAELVHSTPARIERARTIERADPPKLADEPAKWLRCRSCKAISHRDHARRCIAGDDHCVSCGSRDVEAVNLAAAYQARKRAALESR